MQVACQRLLKQKNNNKSIESQNVSKAIPVGVNFVYITMMGNFKNS
jgi:hypothetical protein